MPTVEVVQGDLLDQPVEAIVNPWNRNIIPWWMLLPQGVSGAIKRRAGFAPFRELSRAGVMKLGQAVVTGAGRLPFKAIIHVAGINMFWRASERSIRDSIANALRAAAARGLSSLATPLIGSGSGGFRADRARAIILDQLARSAEPLRVRVVEFAPGRAA